MENEKINELLSEIISQYAGKLGASAAKGVAKKLPFFSAEASLSVPNAYNKCIAAANICGELLDTDTENQMLIVLIQSGFGNMNPALLAAKIWENTVYIKAIAKEGLIKQHTAEKALHMFASAILEENGTEIKPLCHVSKKVL